MGPQVVPPEYAQKIFKASFLTLISFITAVTLQVWDGAAVTGSVFVCSTNYWRRPEYGWRRNIDIVNSLTCLAYQTWRSFQVSAPYMIGFLTPTYFGLGCYFFSQHHIRTNTVLSARAHVGTHFFANVGNVVLYLGLSKQL